MADPTYAFLPWVREGLGLHLAGQIGNRAAVDVSIEVQGQLIAGGAAVAPVNRSVLLYGPGDILGIDQRAIISFEPRPGTGNFESNYLPYVAFYDEDFPWRYTPAAPAGDRLVPWITLVVLRDGEFSEVAGGRSRQASIVIDNATATLPPADQLHLWAHAQMNDRIAGSVVSADAAALSSELSARLTADPDRGFSRLISPRHLTPSTRYHAFVVPTFESGRLAGLGVDPEGSSSPFAVAWAGVPSGASIELPVYARWSFGTAEVGDFEYLVRLLKPRRPDARIGRRPIDTLAPGPALAPIDVPGLGGVLQLGGALKVPESAFDERELEAALAFEQWAGGPPGAHLFQQQLADLVNLTDDFARPDSPLPTDPDPVISPPIYGRWHARTARLLEEPDGSPVAETGNWVHELNLDPRHRVAAGFGTRVVQEGQESFMEAAWAQVGDVLAANRTIRHTRFGREVSEAWHRRTVRVITAASPARALQLHGPMLGRVVVDGTTLAHRVANSMLPDAAVTPALRRVTRARGPLARRALRSVDAQRVNIGDRLVSSLAVGKASAAPSRVDPAVVTVEGEIDLIGRRLPGTSIDAAGRTTLKQLRLWLERIASGEQPFDDRSTPLTDSLRPASVLVRGSEIVVKAGERDNPESRRFKQALHATERMMAASRDAAARPRPRPLTVDVVATAAAAAIEPAVTFRRRLSKLIALPDRLADALVVGPDGDIDEVMAYPVIDTPMYQALTELSDELFVPNLGLIENNSITLLETNQPFIESYMVGLNHEMSRELLWREYPTDQRGTPFRQFWDARELIALTDGSAAARDTLRDIPPLHAWSRSSALGSHDHRDAGGPAEDELVLVIRGELLKRYPNAAIYAHRADWERVGGVIDRTRPRRLVDPGLDVNGVPARADVRLPLYRATVEPDIFFVGFDLTETEAHGGTGDVDTDPAGWFFVIKERPGEPRFGLDLDSANAVTELHAWNELAWTHLPPSDEFIRVTQTISLTSPGGPPASDAQVQFNEDKNIVWSPGTNAADLAYVLYQVPVLVAVHTAEMLRTRP